MIELRDVADQSPGPFQSSTGLSVHPFISRRLHMYSRLCDSCTPDSLRAVGGSLGSDLGGSWGL